MDNQIEIKVGQTSYYLPNTYANRCMLRVWQDGPTYVSNKAGGKRQVLNALSAVGLLSKFKGARLNPGPKNQGRAPYLYDMPTEWSESNPFSRAAWPTIRLAFNLGKVYVNVGGNK